MQGYKWESVRKALAEVNNMCQLAGLLPPAFTSTNPLLRRLQRTAKMAAQTGQAPHGLVAAHCFITRFAALRPLLLQKRDSPQPLRSRKQMCLASM